MEKKKKNNILRFIRLDKTKNFLKKIINPPKEPKLNKEVLEKFKKILNMSKKLVEDSGANFYFIYLPSYSSLTEENIGKNRHQRREILSIVSKLDINLIDIKKIMLEKKINYLKLFPCEVCHYTVDGYKLIANMIYEKTLK